MKKKVCPESIFFGLNPSFNHMPGLTLGATDSAHQVFFGRDGSRLVAVKPYTGESPKQKAKHEYDMLKKIDSIGFLTLNPVKIVSAKDGSVAYLLTDYTPNLTTMSSLVQKSRNNQFTPLLLGRTAETLARLHTSGISHGDAQIKNFGIVPTQKNSIAVFDLEKAGSDTDGHTKSSPYQHDLDSLVQSLAYKAYGGIKTAHASDVVYEQVIEPYAKAVEPFLGSMQAEKMALHAIDTHHEKHSQLHSYKLAG